MDKAKKLKRKIAYGLYLSVTKDVADDILEKMDEYAQQVSREVAIDFYIHHLNYPIDRIYVSKEFDKWI